MKKKQLARASLEPGTCGPAESRALRKLRQTGSAKMYIDLKTGLCDKWQTLERISEQFHLVSYVDFYQIASVYKQILSIKNVDIGRLKSMTMDKIYKLFHN